MKKKKVYYISISINSLPYSTIKIIKIKIPNYPCLYVEQREKEWKGRNYEFSSGSIFLRI